jgi:S1-C subfamily serine protease
MLSCVLPKSLESMMKRSRTLMRAALTLSLILTLSLGAFACSGDDALTNGSTVAVSTAETAVTTASDATTSDAAASDAPATELVAADEDDASYARTLENSTTEIISPAEMVASKVSVSVVNVRVQGVTVSPFFGQEQYQGVGSGIVYTSEGYILTNDHVVSLDGQTVDSVEVTFSSGETLPATVVARDSANDLAVLKVDKTGLTPVVFAESSGVVVGQWAIAIGSPLDYRNSVTEGIVSGLDRSLDTGDPTSPQLTGLLQTDAAISPGNSGGGLFNAAGKLIGMPEAYLPASTGAVSVGFAIPADKVAALAEQLMVQH